MMLTNNFSAVKETHYTEQMRRLLGMNPYDHQKYIIIYNVNIC